MITSFKRTIVGLAFVIPVAALVASPASATSHTKGKTHHASVHKASHKMHSKRASATTTS